MNGTACHCGDDHAEWTKTLFTAGGSVLGAVLTMAAEALYRKCRATGDKAQLIQVQGSITHTVATAAQRQDLEANFEAIGKLTNVVTERDIEVAEQSKKEDKKKGKSKTKDKKKGESKAQAPPLEVD
jgi:hypothetical protein